MFGIILTIIGTLLDEVSTSAGKTAARLKIQNIFTSAFITNACSALMFTGIAIWRWPHMTLEAWPTFLVRLPLELCVTFFTVTAVAKCARSAFGLVRTGTIPMLLLVDALMGYSLSYAQILGIALITSAIFLLYVNHGLERRGLKYAILATLLPVATISLAKYNFNHGNSWELEQALAFLVTTVMLYAISRRKGEYPLRHFKNPFTIIQALATAAGNVILVFGFNLMTPSVHTAAKRSTAVIAAVGSGKIVFHEKHATIKILAMATCVIGVILLVL